jgi:hypothetical protein
MKNVIVGLIGVAGLAAGANAQNLSLSVKMFDGANWVSEINALPGSTVQVGIWMGGDASIYGMGGATLRLTGTGAGAGDSAAFAAGTDTGRVGPFNFGAATNAIFASAGGFRIDAASDAANNNSSAGLTFFQRDPATATPGTFSTANPALCFRFDVSVGADGTLRDITMVLDQLSRGLASYFTASNASRPATAAATLNGGVIHVVPTPATLALIGLGGLVAGRRRSR